MTVALHNDVSSSRALNLGVQVCNVCWSERGRAGTADLLSVPQGALLRAALPEGRVGGPPSSVQAAAGAPSLGAALDLLRIRGLVVCG